MTTEEMAVNLAFLVAFCSVSAVVIRLCFNAGKTLSSIETNLSLVIEGLSKTEKETAILKTESAVMKNDIITIYKRIERDCTDVVNERAS